MQLIVKYSRFKTSNQTRIYGHQTTHSLTAFDLFLSLPALLEGSLPNGSPLGSAIRTTLYKKKFFKTYIFLKLLNEIHK